MQHVRMVGIKLETNWHRGKARARLLKMLFLLFHIQSGVQTSKEDKKKDFAVKTGV